MPISFKKANTITDMVKYGKSLDLSHDRLHLKVTISSEDGTPVVINYSNLLDKYYEFILPTITEVTLSDEEYARYRFQPKMMSYELYGTVELWSALLRINNLTSGSQFTLKKLKVFTTDILEIINEILIMEDDNIKLNKLENNL